MEDKLLAQGINKKWKWIEGEVENDWERTRGRERENISPSFVSGAAWFHKLFLTIIP